MSINSSRVQRQAPGAYPFKVRVNAFGEKVAHVDPAGNPDKFKLGVAMARQGFIPKFGGSSKKNGYGNYVFVHAPDEVEWL
jgi:hypothetical protein